MSKKRPNLTFAIQVVLLFCLIIAGGATLLSTRGKVEVFSYVCMWFIAIVQTLGLITENHKAIDEGDDESGEDTDKEE